MSDSNAELIPVATDTAEIEEPMEATNTIVTDNDVITVLL
jgi:hypothetical protein